jgi:hypothetical protein
MVQRGWLLPVSRPGSLTISEEYLTELSCVSSGRRYRPALNLAEVRMVSQTEINLHRTTFKKAFQCKYNAMYRIYFLDTDGVMCLPLSVARQARLSCYSPFSHSARRQTDSWTNMDIIRGLMVSNNSINNLALNGQTLVPLDVLCSLSDPSSYSKAPSIGSPIK